VVEVEVVVVVVVERRLGNFMVELGFSAVVVVLVLVGVFDVEVEESALFSVV